MGGPGSGRRKGSGRGKRVKAKNASRTRNSRSKKDAKAFARALGKKISGGGRSRDDRAWERAQREKAAGFDYW